ncbi:hypothetical protein SAMN05518801_102145 [Novosphingobium sp. CF614]|uniref:hypothetical protein n=1 Tax=Novosphingobium sp. CF614 TaxID=1884364 RepID=UPI0008E71F00|nr:hypothetical protein [Novosphingobium sp. CF614]SFF84374.1 hypothetical protein SAMN05518801_102145 [Novosphingobium sp. CF614]
MPLEPYQILTNSLMAMRPGSDDWGGVLHELEAIWRQRYPKRSLDSWNPATRTGKRAASDLVWVSLNEFGMLDKHGIAYLFDIVGERLVGAYMVSQGKNPVSRKGEPDDRLKGHPLHDSSLFDRGHTIAHTLGGGCDINVVAQNSTVNRSGRRSMATGFRTLERRAVETPGSLYFVHWLYTGATGGEQVPTGVEQGLLLPRQAPEVYRFDN